MDDFRKEQKKQCGDGTKNKRNPYGCDCCNDGDLRSRKKSQRKLAKVRFRRENERLISTILEKEIIHD